MNYQLALEGVFGRTGLAAIWEARARAEAEQKAHAEKLEIARKALAKGSPVDFVHDITGLDIETIKQLA